ncbi:Hrp1p SCDLUD_005031 [Saccharomycodes ludwigii]|uniref:Hrp1p n=1 Tax=Saccharomycodes ludwigii TaxID=36035 RepID=UPI001E860D26|nr:hypothetical protein SCDLUD_005031 [Saccharomycodes ludwigii]KAH3898707.1 hypothetical protein SCDLUD_005031 [Saccharomycodes ludwigii]
MSYSDDEDFDDIYGGGEEENGTNTTTTTADTTKISSSVGSKNDATSAATEAKDNEQNKSSASNSATLDDLVTLQAISNNISQLNPERENTSTSTKTASTDYNGTSLENNNTNVSDWKSLQASMKNLQDSSSNNENNSTSTENNNSSNSDNQVVKADLSRELSKMFIGGLNWETDEDALKEYFNKYGNVIDLKIMREPNNGRSRGFAFLTFESAKSVDEVLKTQHILDGKVIDPKRAIPREEQSKTGKIFVGGISADVRPKEFEEFFGKFGTIIDAQLMLDKDTGRSRGFGFVTYDSPDAVDLVCKDKYIDFNGKQIEVKRAEPRPGLNNNNNNNNTNNTNNNNNNHNNNGYRNNNRSNNYNNNYSNGNSSTGYSYNNANSMPTAAGSSGFPPMFNPQLMSDYWQKMQDYYQQLTQQTGVDYTQMMQQQQQQMMMNPMMFMSGMMPMGQQGVGTPTTPVPNISSNTNTGDDVPTISNYDNIPGDEIERKPSPPPDAPKGPKSSNSPPAISNTDTNGSVNNHNDHYSYNNTSNNSHSGGNGYRYNNYRGGYRGRGGRGNKGSYRGGYENRYGSGGYHPYSRH